jgi:TonB-linked SusC/RagA family outer membrane protein
MKRITLLLACFILTAFQWINAQTVQVTGTITSSEDGLSLPGAAVVVKGTTIGSVTDLDGNYTINVPLSATSLVYSYVGMLSQEIPIDGRTVINVVLDPDIVGIEEVMVVAYRTVKKSDYTGSAVLVDGEKLVVPGAESIEKSLSGKVSGVRVTSQTGDPGSSGDIQIRGIGSINGSTSPLYVIDGIPMETGNMGHYEKTSNILSSLNPEDIENITVLKDAAAASLYGSRAANGVVIITTKKGQQGDTKFEFNASTGWATMATKSYEMMSGPEYYKYDQLAIENYMKGLFELLPGQQYYGNADSLAYHMPAIDAAKIDLSSTYDSTVNTNWRDVVYRTGKQQDYQLAASGGNEKTQFYISGNYSDIEGIVNGSDFQRYSGRMNIGHKPVKWLNFGLNQMLSFTVQKGYRDQSNQAEGMGTSSPLGILMGSNPSAPKYDVNGNTYPEASFQGYGHPEDLLNGKLQFIDTRTYRSITNGMIQINITPDLSIKSTMGLDWVQVQNFEYWSPHSIDGEALGGLGYRDVLTNVDITSSNLITYNKAIGIHNLSILAGVEASKKSFKDIVASANKYSNEKLTELANGQPDAASSAQSGVSLLSYLSSLSYTIADKYYLTASIRTDGSSKLGKDNRWAAFWSGSLAWRFGQEEFMDNMKWLTDGKLRLSYGTNGNLPPGFYTHLSLYNLAGGYGDNSAVYINNPGNINLGWEKSNNMNAGIELTVLERFSFIIEYYNKLTDGLLLDVPVSYLTGFSSTWENVGKLSNSGIDFEFHSVNMPVTSNFKWRTDFTLSTQKSIVKELPGREEPSGLGLPKGNDIVAGDFSLYLYSEGRDLYSFYLPTWVGVDPETGYGYFLIDPEEPDSPGNRTTVHADAGRSIVAKAYPDVIGGLSNTLSYKGFELDFLVTYSFGGNLFDYPGYFSHHDGGRDGILNLAKDVENNYWTKPGDVVDNPMPNWDNPDRPDRWSTRHIHSTDHIRLKDISLGYNFPSVWVERIKFDNIRLYVRATNLAMWSESKNIDPEVPLNGFRTADTPPTRVISMGLQLGF